MREGDSFESVARRQQLLLSGKKAGHHRVIRGFLLWGPGQPFRLGSG
jgi:hypothetical protein